MLVWNINLSKFICEEIYFKIYDELYKYLYLGLLYNFYAI